MPDPVFHFAQCTVKLTLTMIKMKITYYNDDDNS